MVQWGQWWLQSCLHQMLLFSQATVWFCCSELWLWTILSFGLCDSVNDSDSEGWRFHGPWRRPGWLGPWAYRTCGYQYGTWRCITCGVAAALLLHHHLDGRGTPLYTCNDTRDATAPAIPAFRAGIEVQNIGVHARSQRGARQGRKA